MILYYKDNTTINNIKERIKNVFPHTVTYNILHIESLYLKLKYNNKYVCNTQLYNI